ncbi:MAG: phosphoribosyltransferase [Candidatus Micrarchaeota archaeon]
MEYEFVNWEEVDAMCKQLAKQIKASGFKPDWIVGIARGGLVPARLVSDYLKNRHLAIIRLEFYTAVGVTGDKPRVTQEIGVDIEGKKLLIVDDVSDTGKSLKLSLEYLKNAGEIRTATMHYKTHSIHKPDYFVKTTGAWVVYPWELNESINGKKKAKLRDDVRKGN